MTKVSKKQPLISVVVPVYNVEKYIHKCVDSIVNQTYKNIEIILVNDGSPDNCPRICDDYAKKDKRIKVIHKKNGGLSDARNAGIENAKGEYITFVDSDDFVSLDYIEYLYSLILENNTELAICNIKQVWGNNDLLDKFENFVKIYNTEEAFENLLFSQGIDVSACAKLYKKKYWNKVRFPVGEVYEDSATIYKLIDLSKSIVYGSKSCYFYVAREGSISKQKIYNSNELFYIKNTDEMLKFIRKKYNKLTIAADRYYIYSRIRILRMLVVTEPRNIKLENDYIKSIKKIKKNVLKNSKTPMRDKFAIVTLDFGRNFFKLMWILYCKITHRIT